MNLDSCFKIGQIVKAHGIKGEVIAELDVTDPEQYLDRESVFVLINQKLVPFFIEEISFGDKRAIIKFEDLESKEETNLILKLPIYIPLGELPVPEEEAYSYEELIGVMVKDKSLGEIGPVVDFIERPSQDLLVVEYQGKEVYVPVDPAIILKLERKKKNLIVNLPEGLLEL